MRQHQSRPAVEALESRTFLSASVAALAAIQGGSSPATAVPLNVASSMGELGRGNFDFGTGFLIQGGRSFWYIVDVRFPRPWQLQLRLTQGYDAVTGFLYRDLNDNGEVNRGEGLVTPWQPATAGAGEETVMTLNPGRYFLQVRNDTASTVSHSLSFGARFADERTLDDWSWIGVTHVEDIESGQISYPTYGFTLDPGESANVYRFNMDFPQSVDITTRYRTTNDDLLYFDGGDIFTPAVQPAPAPPDSDPDVQLVADFDNDGRIDPGEVLGEGNRIVRTLPAGAYFLRVTGQIPGGHPYLPYLVIGKGFESSMNRMPLAAQWDGLNQVTPTRRPNAVFKGTLAHNTSNFYKVTVSKQTGLRAALSSGSLQNPDLQVIRDTDGDGKVGAGEILASSTRGAGRTDLANLVLDPGTYFVRALNVSGTPAAYTLSLTGIFTPPTDPGGGFASAFNTGAYAGGQSFMDAMNAPDRRDYYRFTLAAARAVKLTLSSLAGDANVQLFQDKNGNGVQDAGELIATSANTGATADMISQTLAAGTYYVRVYRATETNALYQLNLA